MRVLVLSSHIDDAELSMGGSLIKHRNAGDEIVIAVLFPHDELGGDADTRIAEQIKSRDFLQAKFIPFYGEDAPKIVQKLDKVEADILYFPFESDSHQDHVFTAQIGFAVGRRVRKVFRYIATTSHSYYPTYLNVINMDEKKKLVSVFETQHARNPKLLEIMETQNRFFGSLIPGNGHYAEGFMLFRQVNL